MQILKYVFATASIVLITACGGGSGGGSNIPSQAQTPVTMKLFLADAGLVNGTVINAQNNTISVSAGATISGSVNLTSVNDRRANDIVPVIYQPSWGNRETSYQTINSWVGTGTQSLTANLNLTAPTTPGNYIIYFASGAELNSAQVASSSNWQWNGGQSVWNDGNDIADLNLSQISNSISDGYTVISSYSMPAGNSPIAIGMSFLRVNVTGGGSTFPLTGGGTLNGTPINTQNWQFFPIDVSQFSNGGTIRISVSLGTGQSAASYDLFTTTTPALTSEGRPIGSLVNAYDVPPNTTTNLNYTFSPNGGNRIYYLGINGNWFSQPADTNTFNYTITVN